MSHPGPAFSQPQHSGASAMCRAGCHSGKYTGTDADDATCHVVARPAGTLGAVLVAPLLSA